jgi:two-component sensor histidine kinase
MLWSPSMVGEPIERSLLYVTELLHRVQNDYTRAISLASTMEMQSSEAKDALRQIVDHLLASAKAYHLLWPRPPGELVDFAAEATGLCRAMVSSILDQDGISLNLSAPSPILLDGFRCWRANLILSELITNAARHAFNARGGRISVTVAASCGRVTCRVSDDGSASGTPKPGHGTHLIDALAADLEGNIERRYTATGAVIMLSFPIDPGSSKSRLDS